MAKVSILPWSGKADDRGRLPIYLVVRHSARRATMSLGVRLRPKHWNEARGEVRKSHPDHVALNELVSRARRVAESSIARRRAENGARLEAAAVRDDVRGVLDGTTGDKGVDFLAFCAAQVERYRRRGQAGSARAMGSTVNKLQEFMEHEGRRPKGALPFPGVDVSFFERLRTWELTERGNKKNTAAKTLSHLRVFCNAAIREGLMAAADYPFRHITISRETTPRRQWLKKGELAALAKLRPRPGTVKKQALDIFLFQYYAWGMRISDALFLEWENVRLGRGRLQYRMSKTSRNLDLPLTQKARAIVERYADRRREGKRRVFPLLDGYDLTTPERSVKAKESRTKTVNIYLGEFREQLVKAQKMPGRRKLSTHTARHSAACQMYLAWKDLYRIKRYLGHSSVTQTEKYLRSMEGLPLGEDGEWRDVL